MSNNLPMLFSIKNELNNAILRYKTCRQMALTLIACMSSWDEVSCESLKKSLMLVGHVLRHVGQVRLR